MKKVLVTGVSGYIGLHCAAELLKSGYQVKGSVRNLSKADAVTTAIKKVIDPKGNLEYCQLNLLDDKGWDEAMRDCDYVLHIASPYFSSQPKDENDLIRPAVGGTLRALKAAKKAGVKRVVLTSSIVAMLGDCEGSLSLDQNTWTNVDAKRITAYPKSKTLAEKSAWDFIAAQEGDAKMELVTVHPGGVFGPPINDNLSGESMSMFKDIIQGKMPLLPKAAITFTDVRDVAKIHVQALENNDAKGKRFIVGSERAYSFKEMAQLLKSNGYHKVSTREAPNFFLKLMANFSSDAKGMLPYVGNTFTGDVSETIKTFNWRPIDVKTTLLDTARAVEAILKK